MLTIVALKRETAATSRIRVVQELNRSPSRGSAALHKSDVAKVDPKRDFCNKALAVGTIL